jgi:hypothetical protein
MSQIKVPADWVTGEGFPLNLKIAAFFVLYSLSRERERERERETETERQTYREGERDLTSLSLLISHQFYQIRTLYLQPYLTLMLLKDSNSKYSHIIKEQIFIIHMNLVTGCIIQCTIRPLSMLT